MKEVMGHEQIKGAHVLRHTAATRLFQRGVPLKTVADTDVTVTGRLTLADYYLSSGRTADAKTILQRVAGEKDGFAPARLKLAALAARSGDRKESYRLVDEVLTKNPKDVDALIRKADLLLQDRNSDEALKNVHAALAIEPDHTRYGWVRAGA